PQTISLTVYDVAATVLIMKMAGNGPKEEIHCLHENKAYHLFTITHHTRTTWADINEIVIESKKIKTIYN
ncbi:hypothetical protein ACJX0J_015599, partial [Zea mays]